MSSQPVSALTAILGAAVDPTADFLYIVDTSAGTSGSKKMLASQLLNAVAGSANLDYDVANVRLTVGTGSGTSAGLIVGYLGLSGYFGIWNSGLTPASNNYVVSQGASGDSYLNAAVGQSLFLNIGNVEKGKISSVAGEGFKITAGTATTDVAALSITRTNNNAAVATGVQIAYTDTTSAAGFLALQILGGASATTNLFSVGKTGTIKTPGPIDSGAAANLVLSYNGTPTLTIGAANTPLTVAGLTTGTNADTLCLSAGGVILIQAAACTISSLRFKEAVRQYKETALDIIRKLNPITFKMKNADKPNADWNYDKVQVGLAAEDVAKVVPLAAIYEQDGKTPKSYRQEALIAVLTKGMQELMGRLEKVEARV